MKMYYNKRNLIFVGVLLLFIFSAAVWLVARKIETVVNQMHDSMLEEVGNYRSELIALDFRKTIELSQSIRDYLQRCPLDEEGLQDMLWGFVRMDAKLTRVWYTSEKGNFICVDSSGVIKPDAALLRTWLKISGDAGEKQQEHFYCGDGVLYWTVMEKVGGIVYGLDVSLVGLHGYFARNSPAVKSYAYVLNREGLLVMHPDERMIGHKLTEKNGLQQLHKALNREKSIPVQGFSTYLLLPVKMVYYPIAVGNEEWVVVVNTPDLVVKEEMGRFHNYTSFIVFLTVLTFSILLLFTQYKWRKEYDRRRQLEQETLQLNLQQLKQQVNPHFLFNALNSLNVLIRSNPDLARDFVQKLSKIYRYVLEKRNENLVSVREEIEVIHHYYFLQKIRFGEQLSLKIDDKLAKEERKIPLMSIQMLLENAIKHNEISRLYPLHVSISLENDQVVVENIYRPRTDVGEDSFGVGFESITKIYVYCSDKRFTYAIAGDKFVCRLPLI